MKPEVEKGAVNSRDYTYLVDRVLMNQGKLQVYGLSDAAEPGFYQFRTQTLDLIRQGR